MSEEHPHEHDDPVPHDSPATPPPPPPPASPAGSTVLETTSDDRTMAMLCHLLGIFIGFLGPLIIWLIKKDQSAFVDDQGKEALNFQITVLIAYVIAIIPSCFLLGLPSLAVWVTALVFSIIGALEANKGVAHRYPINIRMIK